MHCNSHAKVMGSNLVEVLDTFQLLYSWSSMRQLGIIPPPPPDWMIAHCKANPLLCQAKTNRSPACKKYNVCIRSKWLNRPAVFSGFRSIKRLGVFLLSPGWDASPSQGYPQHTHFHAWMVRGQLQNIPARHGLRLIAETTWYQLRQCALNLGSEYMKLVICIRFVTGLLLWVEALCDKCCVTSR